jgi:hypothetical protein
MITPSRRLLPIIELNPAFINGFLPLIEKEGAFLETLPNLINTPLKQRRCRKKALGISKLYAMVF